MDSTIHETLEAVSGRELISGRVKREEMSQ
jgi:hypothetical protein